MALSAASKSLNLPRKQAASQQPQGHRPAQKTQRSRRWVGNSKLNASFSTQPKTLITPIRKPPDGTIIPPPNRPRLYKSLLGDPFIAATRIVLGCRMNGIPGSIKPVQFDAFVVICVPILSAAVVIADPMVFEISKPRPTTAAVRTTQSTVTAPLSSFLK
jgi:hypothetical protein